MIDVSCAIIKKGRNVYGISLVPNDEGKSDQFCAKVMEEIIRGGGFFIDLEKVLFWDSERQEISFFISNDKNSVREFWKSHYHYILPHDDCAQFDILSKEVKDTQHMDIEYLERIK